MFNMVCLKDYETWGIWVLCFPLQTSREFRESDNPENITEELRTKCLHEVWVCLGFFFFLYKKELNSKSWNGANSRFVHSHTDNIFVLWNPQQFLIHYQQIPTPLYQRSQKSHSIPYFTANSLQNHPLEYLTMFVLPFISIFCSSSGLGRFQSIPCQNIDEIKPCGFLTHQNV